MPPVLPIAIGLIGLIALLMTGEAKAAPRKKEDEAPPPTPEDKEFSPDVQEKIQQAEATNNAEPLKQAADTARAEGKPAQAAAIDKAYDSMRVESGAVTFLSPIGNVKPEYWTRYVNCVKGKNPKTITPGFALGLFSFGARRLVDLGLMTNPRQGTYKGRTVWTGTWVAPLNINKFLSDSALQYKAFYASMRDFATRIRDSGNVKQLIGRELDGVPITLSGILGVAHRAGWSGMQKWFASAADRAKFPATSNAFAKCNGIF